MADFRKLGKARAHFQERVSEGKIHIEAIDAAMKRIMALEKENADFKSKNSTAVSLGHAPAQSTTFLSFLSATTATAAAEAFTKTTPKTGFQQAAGTLLFSSLDSPLRLDLGINGLRAQHLEKQDLAHALNALANEGAEGKKRYVILTDRAPKDAALVARLVDDLVEDAPQAFVAVVLHEGIEDLSALRTALVGTAAAKGGQLEVFKALEAADLAGLFAVPKTPPIALKPAAVKAPAAKDVPGI